MNKKEKTEVMKKSLDSALSKLLEIWESSFGRVLRTGITLQGIHFGPIYIWISWLLSSTLGNLLHCASNGWLSEQKYEVSYCTTFFLLMFNILCHYFFSRKKKQWNWIFFFQKSLFSFEQRTFPIWLMFKYAVIT